MKDRFDMPGGQATMKVVVTTGQGGGDRLECRAAPMPRVGPAEAPLQVLAAGVNSSGIDIGLCGCSSSLTTATGDAAGQPRARDDGGWNRATPFAFIQGADCLGRVIERAPDVDRGLVGRRGLDRVPAARRRRP